MKIFIIIVGNDVKHGRDHCQRELDAIIQKWNPTILSMVPKYTYKKDDETKMINKI